MSDLVSYTYTVLRYVHDIVTGEFLNVGVVLYCPERNYLRAKTRKKTARLTQCFRGADAKAAKQAISQIEKAVKDTAENLGSLFPDRVPSARDFASRVLPHDDSSLQWSELGAGRTRDPSKELDRLFDRLVTRYDSYDGMRKTERDVWKHFSRELKRRNITQQFRPKTIASSAESVTFEHAWKNGVWHCLEPLSFDLVDAKAIRNKAHRHLGVISALTNTTDPFTVYFLVGEPTDSAMRPQFDQAVRILQSSPSVPVKVFTEGEAEELSRTLAQEMAEHRDSQPWQLD